MKKDEPMDRLIERALRPHDGARPTGACLEAETLAAWTDGALTAAQRAAAEAHAAGCDRCLAVLAAIARTTPPPSEAERSSWFSVRWALPLATAAVAIIAWVLVQAPNDAGREIDALAPVAVESATPAAPAAQTERDVTAQTRAGAAEPENKKAAPPAAAPQASRPLEARRAEASAEEQERITREKLARDELMALPRRPPQSAAASPPAAAAEPQPRALSSAQQVPIFSPDANVRWRIVGAAVERSIDGGRTWTAMPTGTEVPLLAGASPDPRVCWIVGRRGVVLLSSDGETWQRLDFPDAKADLVAVTAPNALSASVTTADGRVYRTDDGGKSWRLQENSVAPF